MGSNSTAQGNKSKKEPKFKLGDWVQADNRVFMNVVAVITDGVLPIYGYRVHKVGANKRIHWHTEFETEAMKLQLGTPDFKTYRALQPGDILKEGYAENSEYFRVLARVDDVVLLSQTPDKDKVKEVTGLAKQIKDLTDGQVDLMEDMADEDRDMLRAMASTTRAAKIADMWMHVDDVCLMNWPIVSNE